MADCALTPALFLVENVLPSAGVEDPVLADANVAAYWAAIQKNEHAASPAPITAGSVCTSAAAAGSVPRTPSRPRRARAEAAFRRSTALGTEPGW